MSLIVLASAKGAPGVTTTAAALGHVWPATVDPVLVELDPSGGDLTARFDLAPEPGLVTLAARSHRSGGAIDVLAHAQPAHGIAVVPAPPGRAAGRAASLLGPALGTALALVSRSTDVLVDVGRLDGTDQDGPCGTGVVVTADFIALVARTSAGDLAHAISAVSELREMGRRTGLVLVGDSRALDAALIAVPVPVIGTLPEDERAAAALAGAPVRRWLLERLPLVRAARCLAEAILGEIGTDGSEVASVIPMRPGASHPMMEQGGAR